MLCLAACGSSKEYEPREQSVEASLDAQNSTTNSLLTRIRKLPGISLRAGVPVFTRSQNRRQGAGRLNEPLYILDNAIVGNSFRKLASLVSSAEVEKIEAIQGADTSIYGAQGANGVIRLTTFK